MRVIKRLLAVALLVIALILMSLPSARHNVEVLAQNPTRLRALLIDHDLDVDGDTDVAGTLTVAGATTLANIDLDGNTLTIDSDGDTTLASVSDDTPILTLGAATGVFNIATGNLKVGNGSPDTAQDGEDAYVEGGLEVDGAIDADGTMDLAGNLTSATGSVTIADTLQVTGLADFDAGLTYGSTPLYPLGNASASQEIVCGTTSTFTGSTTIDATALTTATYALALQVTAPTTTAAYLYASDPSTTTVTFTSLNNTFGAGTTGITAHYCIVGTD